MRPPASKRVMLLLFCGSIAVAGISFFLFKLQYDNKYASWPQASQGVLELTPAHGELIFLWDEWEFYPGRFLTPEEIGQEAPDYLYIGEYGGFELGDLAASHGGSATYRLTLLTQDTGREYALEVPYIFGEYALWVNGRLRRSGAGGGGDAPPYLTMIPENGRIEIVVAVEARAQLYDGMVYPPAFGSPMAVWALLQLRSFLAATLCGSTLFLSALYLYVGFRAHRERLALSYALLGLCYAVSVQRFPLLSIGLSGNLVLIFCRVCYYGIFLALMSILVDILEVKQAVSRAALTLGALMCLWVLVFQLFCLDGTTGLLWLFSATTRWYKYAVALFFVAVPAFSALRARPHALPLLAGGVFFAAALLADRLFPAYEPALIQWPVETAAMVQTGVIAYVLISDTVFIYGDNIRLGVQKRAAQALTAEQARQYAVLARHLEEFAQARHDMRGFLISLQYKCRNREYGALEAMLEKRLGAATPPALTQNSLINAILAVLSKEAENSGAVVRHKFGPLPARLTIDDTDLCVLFTNLIHNAVEACQRIPEGALKTLELSLRYEEHTLYFMCSNTFTGSLTCQAGRPVSTKRGPGHGLGLKIAEEIVMKYGGSMELGTANGFFRALLSIPC